MNIFKNLILLFCLYGIVGCGVIKTGTIADIKYSPGFFNFGRKVPVEEGKTAEISLISDGRGKSQIKKAKSKYIKEARAYFATKSEIKKNEAILKKSEITGREKMVDQFEIINYGYNVHYAFLIEEKILTEVEKIKLEILRADKKLELIAEYFPKTKVNIPKEAQGFLNKNDFLGNTGIIIKTDDYIKGDRSYLYIFKLTLESKNGKLDEVYIAKNSIYHDKDYKYVQGYI